MNKYHHLYQRDSKGRYIKGSVTTVRERFIDKVDKLSSVNGCWLWTGNVTSSGYGKVGLGSTSSGDVLAHRLSWELVNNKPVPKGMYVLHHCDNPLCVNPNHLFVGSQADNIQDMLAKGRCRHPNPARGERNGNSKLTESQVIDIRVLLASGKSALSIGKLYGVCHSTILDIRNRVIWATVD